MFILAPFSVFLSRKYGEQKTVIIGGLLTFIGLFISSLSQYFTLVVFAYGIIFGNLLYSFIFKLGLGLTLVYTPSLTMCTTYFNKRRATALSLSLSGCGFASVCMPFLFQKLLKNYGYSGALTILSSISLHYCVSGALYYKPLEIIEYPIAENTESNMRTVFYYICNIFQIFNCIKIASGIWVKVFLFSFIFNMMGSGPVTTLLVHYAEKQGVR